jgi:hypothetical protein
MSPVHSRHDVTVSALAIVGQYLDADELCGGRHLASVDRWRVALVHKQFPRGASHVRTDQVVVAPGRRTYDSPAGSSIPESEGPSL